jgi:hypothetical protein
MVKIVSNPFLKLEQKKKKKKKYFVFKTVKQEEERENASPTTITSFIKEVDHKKLSFNYKKSPLLLSHVSLVNKEGKWHSEK